MENQEILNQFYSAFQDRDFRKMQSCYHSDATFSDPVFQNLNAKQTAAMWHMLCERGKDLKLTFEQIGPSQIRWHATYSFSKTGRRVHNVITADFKLKDGLIIKHTDQFDLWKWAGMALGPVGSILGWTPFMKSKIRAMAMKGLSQFIAKNEEYK